MRLILLISLLVNFIGLPALADSLEQNNRKLIKIVALSRHGVRAPTESEKRLASWSQKTWPAWPVAKGELTMRGAELVTAMWENMRLLLISKGLFPDQACPPAKSIYIRADTDERTRATAYAMTLGLARGCSLGYAVMDEKIDPLFHPVKAGLYHFNAAKTAIDILAGSGGGLSALQARLIQPLELLDSIIGSPSPQLCNRFTFTPDCKLTDLPNAVSVSSDGTDVQLIGSLSIASSIIEIFLLEYGQWPGEGAGWGMVNSQVLSQLLPVHSTVFDLVNRTSQIAWARGGFLLNEMTKALQGTHSDPKVNEARLVVFVGHDTNIANLGSLLGLDWKVDKYPENGIPPASVLFLELWENGGNREVRASFYAQPMEALHSNMESPYNDFYKFRPVEGTVTSPPLAGEAVFNLDKFVNHVMSVTRDAPTVVQKAPGFMYTAPLAN